MQRNIFLEIEYVGTNYFGFQVQDKRNNKAITIQAILEAALLKLCKEKIRVVYSGRTDRGVHAKGQVVNFKTNSEIPLDNIKRALNFLLPCDIRVKKIKKVPLDFHARFWAKSKIYRYIIFSQTAPSVFWENFSWHVSQKLDLALMKKASLKLIGENDFSLFAKKAKVYRDCIRVIKNISITKRGGFIYIDIEANGFLRSMARNIVSFLVKIGKSQISLGEVDSIIKGKLSCVNKPAPAGGLYLNKVKYE